MARLFALLVMLSLSPLASGESLIIEPKHARFDTNIASTQVQQAYTIRNQGSETVHIKSWKAISDFGEVVNLPPSLAPGESAEFQVDLPLPGKLGESTFRYALFTDEADVERYRFTLSGFVFSVISPENAVIDLGKIEAGSKVRHELTLDAREEIPLELVRIVDAPDWLDASLNDTTVSVGVRPNTSRGIKAGTIRVATNLAQQPFVEITAKAIIEGNLKPSTYVLGFKPAEVGETVQAQMELLYSGKRELGNLELDFPGKWEVERKGCSDAVGSESKCVRITLKRTIEESGKNADVLRFSMPDEPDLEIPFGIMGLNPDQSIREILIDEDQRAAVPAKIDITKAIQEQREASKVEPEPKQGADARKVSRAKGSGPVRLHWKAANDESIYGYMVYRANDRAGPYRRITAKPLPKQHMATMATPEGGQVFVDENVEPGKTYYYYIDTIARNGTQQRLSPVLSKTVTP
ncbi:hypothetical protein [Dokdonella sp.]|uniref:hypothetical protein n=1 Tax=Dokdonella sp. TaxID=2291710 RepID=UPI00352880FC